MINEKIYLIVGDTGDDLIFYNVYVNRADAEEAAYDIWIDCTYEYFCLLCEDFDDLDEVWAWYWHWPEFKTDVIEINLIN